MDDDRDTVDEAPAELTIAFTPLQLLLIALALLVVVFLVRRAHGGGG